MGAAELAADQPPAMLDLLTVAKLAFPLLEVDSGQALDIGYGRSIKAELSADPTAMIFEDQLLALYRPAAAGEAVPVAVFS